MRPKLLLQKDSDSGTGTPSEDASGTPSGTGTPSPPESSNSMRAIAGGVVGGLAALAALVGLFFLCRRRSQVHGGSSAADTSTSTAGAPLYEAPAETEYLHRHEYEMQEDGRDAMVPGPTAGGGVGRVVMGELPGRAVMEELPGDSVRRRE